MRLSRFALGFIASLMTSTALAVEPANAFSSATLPPFNYVPTMNAPNASMTAPLASLDVLGVGLSVEMFRQAHSWVEMQKNPKKSILPEDLKAYETNYTMKDLISEKRSADVLENGATHFVEQWPIPSISIWAHMYKKEMSAAVVN